MSKKNKKLLPSPPEPLRAGASYREKWLGWLFLAWMGFVFIRYVNANPVSPIIDRIPSYWPPVWPSFSIMVRHGLALMSGLSIVLGFLGLGFWFTPLLTRNSALGKLALSLGLGTALSSICLFVLGIFQLFKPLVLWIFYGGLMTSLIVSWFKGMRPLLFSAWQEWKMGVKDNMFIFHALALMIMGVGLMMTLVPECFYDSLVYHLGAPRYYLYEGGIKPFPNLHFNYPLGQQILYVLALFIQGETAAKLIHWSLALMCGVGVIAWSFEQQQSHAGRYAALAFLSTPMAQMNMWTTGVDVGLAFCALVAVWCWHHYARSSHQGTSSNIYLALAGFFSGTCYGFKLTGGMVVLVVFVVHLGWALMQRQSWRQLIKELLIFGGPALIAMSPWLIRSALWTGNPVYPFLSKFFTGLDIDRTMRFYKESEGVTPQHWAQWLIFPWKVSFEGQSGLSFLGPIYLMILPLGFAGWFICRTKEISMKPVFFLSMLGIFGVAYINRLTRYWMPFLVLFSIATFSLIWDFMVRDKIRGWIFKGLILSCVVVNFLLVCVGVFERYQPWPVLLGRESRQVYQSYTHPGLNPHPPIQLVSWAKQNLPEGSKFLLFGEEKVGNLEIPFLASGVYDVPVLSRWARASKSVEELHGLMTQNGITHLLINLAEARRLLGYGIAEFSDSDMALLSLFWDHHVKLIQQMPVPEKILPPSAHPQLFLYEITPQLASISPSPMNLILLVYLEAQIPGEGLEVWNKRLDRLKNMIHEYPDVMGFKQLYDTVSSSLHQGK